MKIALKINWILTILLSMSTGVFKILRQEEDIELFNISDFNEFLTTELGFIQLPEGILLIPSKTRKLRAYIIILTCIITSTAIFANDLIPLGIVSLLFIIIAYFVVIMDTNLLSKNIKNE